MSIDLNHKKVILFVRGNKISYIIRPKIELE